MWHEQPDRTGGGGMGHVELVAWVLLIVAMTFLMHEAAHGIAGALLGYDVFIQVNSSGLVSGDYRSQADKDMISAIGPVVTIIQGLLGVWLTAKHRSLQAFAVVFSALMMRVLAAVASLRLPNDEARLGLSWGVGYWTVHAVVILALLALTIWATMGLKPKILHIAGLFVLVVVSILAVVLAERFLPIIYL